MIEEPELVLADLADEDAPDVAPPLRLATTFHRAEERWSYRRAGHPGLDAVERAAARLDGGDRALAFAAGMGAIVGVLATLPPGGRVVAPEVCYHGTRSWLERLRDRHAIELALVADVDEPAAWAATIGDHAGLVWAEPIANPTWAVTDIAALADAAHRAGARLVVDATATPLTTHPLVLGADVVVHSGSKAYNGHSDVHAGLVVANEPGEWWDDLVEVRSLMGTILQPWDAWLLRRGMHTMPLRVDRATASAAILAERLHGHPRVERVRYPGLAHHPHHDVAVRQMTRGFGTLLSIDLADFTAADAVVEGVRRWTPATSLGGIESLIEHRITVEPPGSPVPDGLLRLSVGIEPVEMLWDDLERALGR